MEDERKVVLIGVGNVGMSYAYALLNQGTVDTLVLLDLNREKAMGEAMDLNHGLPFATGAMHIRTGDYDECRNADIVMLCCGVAQRPGEDRPSLLHRNTEVFRSVISSVKQSGFTGILCVATNPVDVMTRVAQVISGFPPQRVIGTGTLLDTARLRFLLGEYFGVDPRNVHAYVMGEHGESEFIPWSAATIGVKPVRVLCENTEGGFSRAGLLRIQKEVRDSAAKIIAAKGATAYGIGMAMARLTKAILGNERCILTVSAQTKESGYPSVYAGVPTVLCRSGVRESVYPKLLRGEQLRMEASCMVLETYFGETGL